MMENSSLLEMALALVLVLASILALAWVARRLPGISAARGAPMQVVASLSLGSRERLVLVQAGGRQLLLGVAPGRVTPVESCETPIIEWPPQKPVPSNRAQPAGFQGILQQLLRSKK